MDIVSTHGHEALTTKALSARLGVSAPALYRHYASRRELLLVVFSHALSQLEQSICHAKKEAASPEAGLVAMANAIIDFGEANPQLYRLVNEIELTEANAGEQEVYGQKRRLDDEIDQAFIAVEQAIDAKRLRHRTLLMWFTLYGYVTVRRNQPVNSAIDSPEELQNFRDRLVALATAVT